MGIFLGRKPKSDSDLSAETEKQKNYDSNLEFQKHDLYKKGINLMASEKMEDAIRSFELALRLDRNYVDAWIKKGYAHFHLGEYTLAISSYDRSLEIDVNNGEAWNLKGLTYYKMKNFDKAIEACEKALDIDPSDGMSWYNKACYLTLNRKIDEGMEALKRSIEIDISNAKKAVRDRDFESARVEEGFIRIIEVVVLESIRQGYDYVGKIVWLTGMDKQEVEDAVMRLCNKGLIIRREKRTLTSKEEYYELAKDIADRVGMARRTGFLGRSKEVSAPMQELRDISEILGRTRESVDRGDVIATLENFDLLISPSKHGSSMIQQFFDDHRDIRLFQIRLRDKGQDYLNSHKPDIIRVISDLDVKIRSNPMSESTREQKNSQINKLPGNDIT